MKKLFLVIILVFSMFWGCGEELSSPENNSQNIPKENRLANDYDILDINEIRFPKDVNGKYSRLYDSDGHTILNANDYAGIIAPIIDLSSGKGTILVSPIFDISGKVSIAGELSVNGSQIPRWRGELNSDPKDGISGDRYYNITIDKEKVFIESRNKWIVSN